MSELDDIRGFIEVIETGSFSQAAKRLGVSKSIVSRRIARLEADLGTQLMSRTTRGISPTEAGLEFKSRSERILADLADAREAVARQGDELSGRLRLSAPLSFGVRYLAPLLGDFAARHPRLEIEVSYSDRFADLIGEGLDLAIRIGRLKDSSLVARRIAPVLTAVVASPGYLARHGAPERPEDLSRHECLIYTGASSAEWPFRTGQRWKTVHPQGRLRSDSGEAILRWAIDGLGLAALPTFLSTDAIRDGRLIPLLMQYPMPEIGLYVVRPPGPRTSRKIRALIDAAVERFSTDLNWDPCRLAMTNATEKGQAE